MSIAETKHFTPAEANRTLPLVRKIVKDILNASYQVRTIAESLGGDTAKLENNDEVTKLSSDIENYMKELQEIGCYYKDWSFSVGLVDFPAVIDGKDVLLCWRSDEEEIRYYHDYESGYTGRKLIPEKYFK